MMSDTDTSDNKTVQRAPARRRRSAWWVRVLKWIFGSAAVILALLLAAVGVAVWILTPDRLTPLVCKYGSEYLDAEVKAARVELTFWSTFPRLTVEADSFLIISHSLHGASAEVRSALPSDADSLLSVNRFSGGINLASLLAGHIHIYDVSIDRPAVNLVQADSVWTNYNIVPPSEPDTAKTAFELPLISFDRFAIKGAMPIRYRSLADTMDVSAVIDTVGISGKENSVYRLTVSGNAGAKLPTLLVEPILFGLDGKVEWSPHRADYLRLNDFTIRLDEVEVCMDAHMQFADSLKVHELKLWAKDVRLKRLIELVPDTYRGELGKISTDLTLTLGVELLKPYTVGGGGMPSAKVDIDIPKGTFKYGRLDLARFELSAVAMIDGMRPDASVVTLRRFGATGRAIDFTLKGEARKLLSDPTIDGEFNGSLNMSMLPAELLSKLPVTLRGTLTGHADVHMRQSWLTPRRFHRIRLNGNLELTDFHMAARDSSLTLFTRHAAFKLGTGSKIKVNGQTVDSLLTASLTVDTVAFGIPGMWVTAGDMSMGLGSRNVAQSADTSKINPMGASIRAAVINMRSDSDSMRVRMRDAFVRATLQRYNSAARSPLLKLEASLGALRFADRYNRLSLREADVTAQLHPKTRPAMSARVQAAYDSIAALHPALSSDSIMNLTRRHMRAHRAAPVASDGRENIDFQLDNSMRSWLRLWQASGTIKARSARMFTPYFPVRNSISDVDVAFSTDSINIHDAYVRMGQSDFRLRGALSNISRALTSRRGAPLRLELDVESDTLNINDITAALMRGAVFSEKLRAGTVRIADSDNDEVINASLAAQVDTTERAAFVVPSNIVADIHVGAGTVKYGDILFQRFRGDVSAADGAIQLNRLGAFTPMGSMSLTALYSAPEKTDVRFAAGMVVRKLDLHEFLHMIPAIDSVLPMLDGMEGIIDVECALTTELDSLMNFKFHTIDMAMKLSGDSLVLLDGETFRTVSKWLMFKNKKRNMIDSMSVEMMIRDSHLLIYPFMVNIDRYRFGISGSNDMAMNLDYHIAVLKSPIPFKFGVNIKGTPEHLKIRLGGAHFDEKQVASSRQLTDTVRINLIREIQSVFKFGVKNGRYVQLTMSEPKPTPAEYTVGDTISASDSLFFIRQGVIAAPPGWVDPDSVPATGVKQKKKRK
ncbi:MAG: hypothetical protein NC043_01415 [Muribaculaceae bacterium]|nr:hypothetical protein [Muribaculaceae bacterium]